MRKDLEKVVRKDLGSVVKDTMQRFLGVSIDELNKDITAKLMKNPFIDFDIDTKLPFKQAKRLFRKQYLRKLLQINYGNISEVARVADIDRRSIHRIVKEGSIDVERIRREMEKAYNIKQQAVNTIIEDVLGSYKTVIHPVKLGEVYKNVPEASKDILDELPEKPVTLKEAEELFEKEYLEKALKENNYKITQTARKIGLRYETLHRKASKLGII